MQWFNYTILRQFLSKNSLYFTPCIRHSYASNGPVESLSQLFLYILHDMIENNKLDLLKQFNISKALLSSLLVFFSDNILELIRCTVRLVFAELEKLSIYLVLNIPPSNSSFFSGLFEMLRSFQI